MYNNLMYNGVHVQYSLTVLSKLIKQPIQRLAAVWKGALKDLCNMQILLYTQIWLLIMVILQGDQRSFNSLSEVEIHHMPHAFQVRLKVLLYWENDFIIQPLTLCLPAL